MKQSKQNSGTGGGQGLPIGIPALQPEYVPEAVRPFVEIGMKMQSEFLKLYGHRCGAWLHWPEKFCSCKTMEDLTSVHSDYLTRMSSDYATFLDGVLRDTLIEQDEFEEDAEKKEHRTETGASHLEVA